MATPTEHAWREFLAFVRGPAGLNSFGFGTADEYRASVQHVGLMSIFPTPNDSEPDAFGIFGSNTFTVEIADEPAMGGIDGLGADWALLLEDGSYIVLEDGTGHPIMEY